MNKLDLFNTPIYSTFSMVRETGVHKVENTPDNQQHLEDNELHFSAQCRRVIQLLDAGVRLTRKSAMVEYGINSLERRFKDICDHYRIKGIEPPYISEWVLNGEGKRIYKVYKTKYL